MGDGAPVRSERGKEILAYAMDKDHCVLEFREQDDGTMSVQDITEHVNVLEDIVRGDVDA